MENQYTNYYKNHSVKELLEVAENSNSYENEARLAAYKLLEEKKVELKQELVDEMEAIKDSFVRQIRVAEEVEVEEIQEWYSPAAVLGFSIFMPIIGAFLMSHNFRRSRKDFLPTIVIIVGVIFTFFIPPVGNDLLVIFLMSLVFNTVAGLIFTKFFWRKYLGNDVKYQSKSIKNVLLIIAGMIILMMMYMRNNPELMEGILKQQQL